MTNCGDNFIEQDKTKHELAFEVHQLLNRLYALTRKPHRLVATIVPSPYGDDTPHATVVIDNISYIVVSEEDESAINQDCV